MPEQLRSLQALHDLDLIAAIAVFVLVLAIWIMAVTLWHMGVASRERRIDARLMMLEPEEEQRVLRLWRDGRDEVTHVPGGSRLSPLQVVDRWRREAGWEMPLSSLVLAEVGATVLLFVFALTWTGFLLAAVASAAAVPLVTWICMKRAAAGRTMIFETQFLDALQLAARSLRAGHPLLGSLQLVSEEMPAPVGALFGRICQQQALGLDLPGALRDAADDSGSDEMKLFATSVSIQIRTGGNLADLMDRLAEVITERMRLARRVRVLTAQTQLSKRVLLVLPVLTFAGLSLLNPDYMEPLYRTSLGHKMLLAGGAAMLLGTVVMNRMAIIRY